MRFTIPISKAEEQADGSVIVEGIATSEAVDSQGEVVDYAAAVESFGRWPGNIREMHQPIAAGRSLGVTSDDATKTIHLRAFVSAGATETKAKVLDGTLKSFSIGGRAAKRVKEGDHTRLFLSRVNEVSLVDVGANPECSVSIAKMDGAPSEDVHKRFAEWALESGITVPQPDVEKVGFAAYPDSDAWNASRSTFDALRALYALAVVETLAAIEADEEQGPEEAGQAAQLAAAVANLKAFIAAEITETHDAPAPVLMAEPAGDVAKVEEPAPAEGPPPDPPAEKAETLNPAPAAEAGVSVSGGDVEKADTTGADVAKALLDLAAKVDTLKADLDASREEGIALQARIEKMSTRVVDPGRPVFKDASGRLTATNPDAGASNHGVSADDVRKLWSEYPDPASFQRALAGKLAEAETRAALFGGSR